MKHESLSYIQEAVKKHEKEAAVLSDHLAANPEVAYEEFKSSRAMADLLKQAGFQVTYPFCFLQALFPQKCRVTSSKLHGEFPQYCISPSGTLLGAGGEPLQAYKVY